MKITLPESWKEISIRKFSEVCQAEAETDILKSIEIISILSDTDPELLKGTDMASLNLILDKIKWTGTQPGLEPKTEIEVKGEKYYLVSLKSLSNGEWADLDVKCEDHINNIHRIMSILYRKEGEEYNTKVSEERALMFLDECSIEDVYGTMVFFSLIGKKFIENMSLFIQDQMTQKTT